MRFRSRIAIPDSRARAIDLLNDGIWRVWLGTPDFIHGTHLLLYPNGKVERVVVRQDEGDEIFLVKGAD